MSCRKPTFHIASSSSRLLLCASVFSRERDSLKTPYPGRLMPRAYEHICLSRSVGASCACVCLYVCAFSCMRLRYG